MDQKIINLYSHFKSGRLERREFLKKITLLTGSTVTSLTLLPLLEDNYSKAAGKTFNATPLHTEYIKYPGFTGEIRAYLARPEGDMKLPAVIVIHENRGLVPHIEDVTRRMALEGFIALAPDALSPLGGTPKDMEEGRTLMQQLDN